MKNALLLLAIVALAASCTSPVTRLTAADAGRTIDLRVGDELVLALESNPSTGYDWEVASPAAALQLVEKKFTPQSSALGAAGMTEYRFKVASDGAAKLTLNYWRSWESVPPQKTFEVTLNLKPR